MDPQRWDEVQAVFHEALEVSATARRAFVESRCVGDPDLAAAVMTLLQKDGAPDTLLNPEGLPRVARQILGPEPVPRTIASYEVLAVLGRGGMGEVYLAEREDLDRKVAIKVLSDALSAGQRERFAREQRTLARLDHPSIARLYDADVLPDGTPYFVMEHVVGTSVTEHCDAADCSMDRVLGVFREICRAVMFAHRKAVIHRDLKPSNILVTEDGRVKLLDFGIAREIEEIESDGEELARGTGRGRHGLGPMTPAYASPEQIRGEMPGVQTDVYALGVILYELLTGKQPFGPDGPTLERIRSAGPERIPESPSKARNAPEGSPGDRLQIGGAEWADLDALCLTALRENPAERYPSVEALVRDLDHFVGGEPLEARGGAATYRLGKFFRRHRREVAAACLVIGVIAGLVAFYTVQTTEARNQAVAEAERAERVVSFMLNLFEGGDGAVGPADSLRVVTLLEQGVRGAAALDGEPEVQAELYATLGKVYQQLGDLDRADSLLQRAFRRRVNLAQLDPLGLARSSIALGLLREDQARLDDAERRVRTGLEIAREHLSPGHPLVAEGITALGKVLQSRGEYAKAIDLLETAARLRAAQDPESIEFLDTLTELANTHFYAGDYAASDSLNRIVIELAEEEYGPRHPFVANALINLGASQGARDYWGEAEPLYRRALAINRSYYGEESDETAANLMMLGQSLANQERYDEARDVLDPALETRRQIYGEDHPRVANVLNELGTVALYQGDLDAAEKHFRRMAEIYRAAHEGPHFTIGIALSNLASVHRQAEEYGRAETAMREAVEIFAETQGPDHVNTAIGRLKLGRILVLAGRHAEAEPHLLAGYETMSDEANPSGLWLKDAREDLVAVYEALGQPEEAARYRGELEAADPDEEPAAP